MLKFLFLLALTAVAAPAFASNHQWPCIHHKTPEAPRAPTWGPSPVAHGERRVKEHPRYPDFVRACASLGVTLEWVKSVEDAGDMKRAPGEIVEGLFDDETNTIYLNRAHATLATLVHELRHAVHFGTNHKATGSRFDRAVFAANLEQKRIAPELERLPDGQRIANLLDTMIVDASEISAHYHDLLILIRRRAHAQIESSLGFRRAYRHEFMKALRALEELGALDRYPFFAAFARETGAYYHFTAERLRAAQADAELRGNF